MKIGTGLTQQSHASQPELDWEPGGKPSVAGREASRSEVAVAE